VQHGLEGGDSSDASELAVEGLNEQCCRQAVGVEGQWEKWTADAKFESGGGGVVVRGG